MKILVVEDEAMVRSMIVRVCRTHPSCESVSEARDGASALAFANDTPPDLVFLDIDLPDGDGLDLIPQLSKSPGVRIVVLSSSTDDYSLHRCFSHHLQGFIDKNEHAIDGVSEAIQAVFQGLTYFSPTVVRARAAMRDNPLSFTKILSIREQELLRLFGQGLTNEEVAEKYDLAAMTVKNHRRNILAKLDLHSTPELIRFAAERGFTRFRPVHAAKAQ